MEYYIEFFSCTHVSQITEPPDYKIWLDTMDAEFGSSKFKSRFQGPMWSGCDKQGVGCPRNAKVDIPYVSTQTQNKNAQKSPFTTKPVVQMQGERDSSALITHTRDGKKDKRLVGAVIAGQLTISLLRTGLNEIPEVTRKAAIGIENKSGYTWDYSSVYFFAGTSDSQLPSSVASGNALVYNARKTTGPTATGAVGVLTYYIENLQTTLAVMFSVPFDYNLYSNWWNVKLYTGIRKADYGTYHDLYYYADPLKGDDGWYERKIGWRLKIRGSMSSSGQATLLIHVNRA